MQMEIKRKLEQLYSDKRDFKTKIVIKDKEEHYIMIKESIQQEDVTFINIYASNIGESKYIKKILTEIKGEIDSNTVIGGDFNTPLTSMNISSTGKKINKKHWP